MRILQKPTSAGPCWIFVVQLDYTSRSNHLQFSIIIQKDRLSFTNFATIGLKLIRVNVECFNRLLIVFDTMGKSMKITPRQLKKKQNFVTAHLILKFNCAHSKSCILALKYSDWNIVKNDDSQKTITTQKLIG